MLIWAEWVATPDQSADGGTTVVTFAAYRGNQLVSQASVTFQVLQGMVMVFGGLVYPPQFNLRHIPTYQNPAVQQVAIYALGQQLYAELGYDVHPRWGDFNEPWEREIEQGIGVRAERGSRGVKHVVLIGWDSGALTVYEVARKLTIRKEKGELYPFEIRLTAYVDGVYATPNPARGAWDTHPLDSRPRGSELHVNHYQTNGPFQLRGGNVYIDLRGGPIIGPVAADKQYEYRDPLIDHFSLSEDALVYDRIKQALKPEWR
jgi:hypothetical protein